MLVNDGEMLVNDGEMHWEATPTVLHCYCYSIK